MCTVFVYLGAEVAGEITMRHIINIAWGRFGEYRHVLTAAKLPVRTRSRLYIALIVYTMTYACGGWLFVDKLKKKLNRVNSKMLFQITRRSIHLEAAKPTFNIFYFLMQKRWEYLGQILRIDDHFFSNYRLAILHTSRVRCLPTIPTGQ